MNRQKAHRIFIIFSIYLLGIIVIIGLFLIPQFKERFAKTKSLAEEFPFLERNYTSYPLQQRIIWMDEPDKTIPIIAAKKYDTRYFYEGNIQKESSLNYTIGVFVEKKQYVVFRQNKTLEKPELFGPFKIS